MGYGFWFDPILKGSNVDSNVYGNKFLSGYWNNISSSNSQPIGTDITPKQVFQGDPYESLYNQQYSGGSTPFNPIFEPYYNIGSNNNFDSYESLFDQKYSSGPSSSYGSMFDSYYNIGQNNNNNSYNGLFGNYGNQGHAHHRHGCH